MKQLACKTGVLLLAILLALSLSGCQQQPEPDYGNPLGDPLFYNVQWNEDIDAIIKKAGKPDEADDHFLTYEDEEVFGQPCKVVLVVDFSYSYPGLYSVTHTFREGADAAHIRTEMVALFGPPQSDDGTALWVAGGTTIVLSEKRH